jgi:hypothetical protein
MKPAIEIQGGAGEFEAAVIAVVLDRIAEEEKRARQGRPKSESELSNWIKAIHDEDHAVPLKRRHAF